MKFLIDLIPSPLSMKSRERKTVSAQQMAELLTFLLSWSWPHMEEETYAHDRECRWCVAPSRNSGRGGSIKNAHGLEERVHPVYTASRVT